MSSFLNPVVEHFYSWANNLPKRILLTIVILIFGVLADSFFGFSFFYKINNEINTLSKIQEINQIQDKEIDIYINEKKNEIIHHKYLLDYVTEINISKKSILLFIASNWFFIFMAILLPFLAKGKNIIGTILIVELVLAVLMTIIYIIVILLPKFDNDILNYVCLIIAVPVIFFMLFSNGDEGKKP